MNTEKFAYWLQGALEMNPEMLKKGMSPEQVQTIQDHLNLVFDKTTPDRFNKEEVSFNFEDTNPSRRDPNSTNWNPEEGLPQLFCSQVKHGAGFSARSGGTPGRILC